MSIHGSIDRLAVGLGSKFMRKYFRDGWTSPDIKQTLEGIDVNLPLEITEALDALSEGIEATSDGRRTDYNLTANTPLGPLGAGFRLAAWQGPHRPAIIYHHGASEIPFDYGFKGIFPINKMKIDANLFLVRAPFHTSMKEFQQGIRTLENVVTMMCVSVKLIEGLVGLLRGHQVPQIIVAGTSLGGFITNLHHIHFNSADTYTPLLAGLAMDDAYLNSAYSASVHPSAKEHPEDIKRVLNFEQDFKAQRNLNVYPLLARYDRLITYDRQKASYGDVPVAVIDKGHTTGALAYSDLRKHVLAHLADGT